MLRRIQSGIDSWPFLAIFGHLFVKVFSRDSLLLFFKGVLFNEISGFLMGSCLKKVRAHPVGWACSQLPSIRNHPPASKRSCLTHLYQPSIFGLHDPHTTPCGSFARSAPPSLVDRAVLE